MLVGGFVITVDLLTGPLDLSVPPCTAIFFASALALGTLLTLAANERHTVLAVWLAMLGSSICLFGQGVFSKAPCVVGVAAIGAALTLKSRRSVGFQRTIACNLAIDANQAFLQVGYRSVRIGDAVRQINVARRVILVPGYGLTIAQAQDQLCELTWLLLGRGIDVKVAVHPFAGRVPHHLEGLLRKAGLPQNVILCLSEANARFSTTDVALVVGANDIINRAASYTRKSPIFGLPVLNIARATKVYVAKRGDGRGYSGVANDIFLKQNCELLYGDAQATLDDILSRLRTCGSAQPGTSSSGAHSIGSF
jgi:NAD(P) transhydrogenase subunit beta